MTELEYANMYLGKHKIVGDEIKPLYCPYCGGGNHQDRYTFALNMENHTFNCMRGSCGVKGHFSELCREKGVSYDGADKPKPSQKAGIKQYKKPSTDLQPLSEAAKAYIHSRGIDDSTVAEFGIMNDGQGNIALPFYRSRTDRKSGSPTFIKYRLPRKIEKGERKMWRETGAEPILYGLDLCSRKSDNLVITEGEFDCMVLRQATKGSWDVVSVPSGVDDLTWIDTCRKELDEYASITVIGDSDEPGQRLAAEIAKRLPEKRIFVPDYETYSGAKDANEILLRFGAEKFLEIAKSLKPLGCEGLLNIANVKSIDYSRIPRTLSGMARLDYCTGGFLSGDLTVWTGKRGEGKSTVLNQIALDAVNQNETVCIYSGEIPADRLKKQLLLCAAGSENLESRDDRETGRTLYYVNGKVRPLIEKWLSGRIWLYDNKLISNDERDGIIDIFRAAYHQCGARVFIVDNLMTVSLGAKASEFLQIQADFVIRLRKFAEKYGVHVHVVVHPRKTSGEITDSDDVGGLGTITNIACNVLSVSRPDDAWKEEKKEDCDTIIRVLKCRATGVSGQYVPLLFSPDSRRFREPFAGQAKIYGWERGRNEQK